MNLADRVNEMNARLFALEGRMTSFEKAAAEDREYRKEVHARLLEGQNETKERVRKIDLKLAYYAGGLAVLLLILKFADLTKLFIKGP